MRVPEVMQSRPSSLSGRQLRLPSSRVARDFAPDGLEERVEPLPSGCRHRVERNAGRLQMSLEPREPIRVVERVHLVCGDEHAACRRAALRTRRAPERARARA